MLLAIYFKKLEISGPEGEAIFLPRVVSGCSGSAESFLPSAG